MRVAIVGTGYVGLTQGVCLAEIGHDVVCVDIDEKKIKSLKRGKVTFYEPGLDDMMQRNTDAQRLTFTTDVKKAIQHAEIVFSAVGTPEGEDHRADLTAVRAVARDFGRYANEYKVFVNKSTVPVGTAQECENIVHDEFVRRSVTFGYDVVSNPEFLREGVAVQDFLKPDRIIVGSKSSHATEMMNKLYTPIIEKGAVFFSTDIQSAEVIKYAANAFLATKISFMNEIASFCEQVGADVTEVEHGIGLDSRIGRRFLHAGIGFGGSCFPKDLHALIQSGKDHGYEFKIISEVQRVNQLQKEVLAKKLMSHMPNLSHKTITLWGLSFKQKTDDMREAPSLTIIEQLLMHGARIRAYDPVAMDNCKKLKKDVRYEKSALEAAKGSDALLLITDWDEFRGVDFEKLRSVMRGDLIGDGRNIWKPSDVRSAGFRYFSIGRK